MSYQGAYDVETAPSSLSCKREQDRQQGEPLSYGGYSIGELTRAAFLICGALILSVFAFSNAKQSFLESSSGGFNVFKITSFEDIPRETLFANFSTPEQQKLFAMFVERYARGVTKDAYGDMFARFKLNLDKIDARNAKESSRSGTARHGINKFTGASEEELSKLRGGKKPKSDSANYLNIRGLAKPADVASYSGTATSVDWSDVYTTAVRDQGYCGGCWAFSAAAQMESDGIRQGLLTTSSVLSPQQLISCSTDNDGCSGGWTEFAFSYAMETGIELDSDYPYTSYDEDVGKCKNDEDKGVVMLDSFYVITSEDSMIDYIMETGPLSVCIDSSDWDSYLDGIVSSCGSNVDHCVQLVGVDLGENSWKVRLFFFFYFRTERLLVFFYLLVSSSATFLPSSFYPLHQPLPPQPIPPVSRFATPGGLIGARAATSACRPTKTCVASRMTQYTPPYRLSRLSAPPRCPRLIPPRSSPPRRRPSSRFRKSPRQTPGPQRCLPRPLPRRSTRPARWKMVPRRSTRPLRRPPSSPRPGSVRSHPSPSSRMQPSCPPRPLPQPRPSHPCNPRCCRPCHHPCQSFCPPSR